MRRGRKRAPKAPKRPGPNTQSKAQRTALKLRFTPSQSGTENAPKKSKQKIQGLDKEKKRIKKKKRRFKERNFFY